MFRRLLNATIALFLSLYITSAQANNTLILDTLYEQGSTFISIKSLSGRTASAFSVYKMMMRTDADHPKTHAFAMLLDTATQQQVALLAQQGDTISADRLKLEYLSIQYEVGIEPSPWAAIKQSFGSASTKAPTQKNTAKTSVAEPNDQLSEKAVKNLVKFARQAIKNKALFTPAKKNAYHALHRVLRSDPKNDRALKYYFQIFEKFEDKVERLIDKGELDEAIRITSAAVEALPNNFLLKELHNKATGKKQIMTLANTLHNPNEYLPELSKKARRATLSNGKSYLKKKQFFAPQSTNAFDKFAKVLTHDPMDSKALDGMSDIFDEVDEMIVELLESGQYATARSLLEQGLEKVPGLSYWQFKLETIILSIEGHNKRLDFAKQNYSTTLSSKSIRNLLKNTKVYIKDGLYFSSDNESAQTSILRVIATEPEEIKAYDMLDKLIDDVIETSTDLILEGDLTRADNLLEQALQHNSSNSKLLKFSSTVDSLLGVISQ